MVEIEKGGTKEQKLTRKRTVERCDGERNIVVIKAKKVKSVPDMVEIEKGGTMERKLTRKRTVERCDGERNIVVIKAKKLKSVPDMVEFEINTFE